MHFLLSAQKVPQSPAGQWQYIQRTAHDGPWNSPKAHFQVSYLHTFVDNNLIITFS